MIERVSTSRTITLATATITAVATSILLQRAVSKYGVRGTLRLLWEGDHLPPPVREAMDALDEIEEDAIPAEAATLESIEIAIETAKLNSVDSPDVVADGGYSSSPSSSSSSSSDKEGSNGDIENSVFRQAPGLKKDLAMLSHKLDVIAADVDSVRSDGNEEVKQRKKHLSNVVVRMMEQVDGLIAQCGGTATEEDSFPRQN